MPKITFVINDDVISHFKDGFRCRRTYYPKDSDVIANADGTFSIDVTDPKDADLAVTKDTRKVFLYDEGIGKWWKQ